MTFILTAASVMLMSQACAQIDPLVVTTIAEDRFTNVPGETCYPNCIDLRTAMTLAGIYGPSAFVVGSKLTIEGPRAGVTIREIRGQFT